MTAQQNPALTWRYPEARAGVFIMYSGYSMLMAPHELSARNETVWIFHDANVRLLHVKIKMLTLSGCIDSLCNEGIPCILFLESQHFRIEKSVRVETRNLKSNAENIDFIKNLSDEESNAISHTLSPHSTITAPGSSGHLWAPYCSLSTCWYGCWFTESIRISFLSSTKWILIYPFTHQRNSPLDLYTVAVVDSQRFRSEERIDSDHWNVIFLSTIQLCFKMSRIERVRKI